MSFFTYGAAAWCFLPAAPGRPNAPLRQLTSHSQILANHLADAFRGLLRDKRDARRERSIHLGWALGQLPEAQREAVEMHHLQGLTLAETAEELRQTTTAVGGLLRRGLAKLRELLQEDTR